MLNQTWRSLMIAHRKLHELGIKHNDTEFAISYFLMHDIKDHPADWPVGLFTYHEGMWN